MTVFSYSFRSSAFASERHYLLTPDRLTWTGDAEGDVAYQAVAKINVYQSRFWGSSRSYWTCILYPYNGKKIYLGAAHRLRWRAIEDRTQTYIPFVKELEARIAAANVNVRLVIGRGWLSRLEGAAGWIAVRTLWIFRRFDRDRSVEIFARIMCALGPRLRGQSTAREQLKAAFPEKGSVEIERILNGMWDNIGRVIAEYAYLDRLWDFDPARPGSGRILLDRISAERCLKLGSDRKPALMFGAHLANWEIPPLAAAAHGRKIVLLYRQPKIGPIAKEVTKIRGSGVAGLIPAGFDAPFKIWEALQRSCLVGMLVDQYDAKGIEVSFFGRSCRVSSTLGRVARLFECPIYGARVVRLPNRRYRFELTEPLTPPRDREGKIDVAATMQMVTSIVESWVSEHPEQWMWIHRRWR